MCICGGKHFSLNDFTKMNCNDFYRARQQAQERNAENNLKLETDYANSADSVPIQHEKPAQPTSNDDCVKKSEKRKSENSTKESDSDSDDSSSSEDEIGPQVPKSDPSQDSKVKPPESSNNKAGPSAEADSSDDEDEEETLDQKIPRSHECKLQHGNRAVSALAIDPRFGP